MIILGSDFDNTLFFLNDKEKTKRNVAAVKKFISKGNIFCLITGRTYMELEKDLKEIDLPYSYMICADGAMIFNGEGICIKKTVLNDDIIEKSILILKENGYVPYLEDGYKIVQSIDDCIKVSAEYSNRKDAVRVTDIIRQNLNVYAYASRAHINVNNVDCNKKQAIKKLAELENISLTQIYVIGDEVNDYEMLEHFNGAVVKKHNPKLDELNLPEYDTLYQYIEFLLNK